MGRILVLLMALLTLAACAGAAAQHPTPAAGSAVISITAPAFAAGAPIPAQYTCQGQEISPALDWSPPPAGTQSLALIMDDPDAPGGTWVHWLVYNLPPETSGLPEGASRAKSAENSLPQGALQGKTSFKRSDYGGPCPPSGQHRYYFHLYALDIQLTQPGLTKPELLQAMDGHILAQGEVMGVYQKQ